MFGRNYLFVHRAERLIDIPAPIIMENICDFEHVNFVHKRCFAYARIIKRVKNLIFLEYGVKHIPRLPWVTHYFMIHEQVSANRVIHLSKSNGRSSWVRSEMCITEEMIDGKAVSRYVSMHERYQSVLLRPFEKVMIFIANYWADIVWKEDLAILQRRSALVAAGFIDGAICGRWINESGNTHFAANFDRGSLS